MKTLFLSILCLISVFINAQAPTYEWAKFMNGSNDSDTPFSISVDGSGNVYTVGEFRNTVDFDPGVGVFNLSTSGGNYSDIFISKLDANGNFSWAKQIGSSGYDHGESITLDASGNIYVTGVYTGTVDFNPGSGVSNLTAVPSTFNPGPAMFVLKLDASGNFSWAKSIGQYSASGGNVSPKSIIVDASGNTYATGYFSGNIDFNPGTGSHNLSAINNDIFISKLDASGNFVWTKQMGGSLDQVSYSIALDATGNIYMAGSFDGTSDFNPSGTGTYTLTSNGNDDAFISKLDANGNFVWANQIGGISSDYINSIKLDGLGNIYAVGKFDNTVDFDPGVGIYSLTSIGTSDAFISKLDASGNFVWAKQTGVINETMFASDLSVDALSNVYVLGGGSSNSNVDFDPGVGTYTLTLGAYTTRFISKLDASGNFVWAKIKGSGSSITTDASGNIYTSGAFAGTAYYDTSTGTFSLTTSPNYGEIFVDKLNQITTTDIKSIASSNNQINIYPNPNNGNFILNINHPIDNTEFIMINSVGQEIYKKQLQVDINNINIEDFSKGIYVCIIKQNDVILIGKQKIVIE